MQNDKIQLWTDSTGQEIQKLIKEQQINRSALQSTSIIAHSFKEKLGLCDLKGGLDKQRQINVFSYKKSRITFGKMQKECQESQHSRVLDQGELKQVPKMAKEVINQKQNILNECRKVLAHTLANKASSKYKNIKVLLNIFQ